MRLNRISQIYLFSLLFTFSNSTNHTKHARFDKKNVRTPNHPTKSFPFSLLRVKRVKRKGKTNPVLLFSGREEEGLEKERIGL